MSPLLPIGRTDLSKPHDAPLFTIEHSLEMAGTAGQVWSVLLDFPAYAEWNPYVLAISGVAAEGSDLEVVIQQSNWPQPLTVRPVVARVEVERVFHWRGSVGGGGVLDTDHSFHIEPVDQAEPVGAAVRFVQREEFRGSLAENLQEAAEEFTREAFRAMNEALAVRVGALGKNA
jgi:hypothetical protein